MIEPGPVVIFISHAPRRVVASGPRLFAAGVLRGFGVLQTTTILGVP